MTAPNDPLALDTSRERVLAALVYAAARFVPVPLLDDLLRARIATWVVSRAASAIPRAELAPLGEDSRGLLHGCLGMLLKLPLAIVLFPVRKLAAIVFGVRNLVRDVLEVVLLARVVDRALADGTLRADLPAADQRAASLSLRGAFDRAFQGTDLSVLQSALFAVRVPLREVIPAALRRLRALRGDRSAAPVPALEDGTLSTQSDRIARALGAPEVRETLRAFDARVATELARPRDP